MFETSFGDTVTDEIVTADRCHSHSGFILEYQRLYNRYMFCLANLQEFIKEADALREENESLRLANADLVRRLSLLSQATIQNCLLSDFNRLSVAPSSPRDSHVSASNITSSSPSNPFERVSLPKSISIRSTSYLKEKASQRMYVAGRREEEGLQLDVYNQGMSKMELCNKWQETGTCTFAENCQFAHGIMVLRPVIRHPPYKTEVCRMILAGDICPYGHRRHFRHSLADLS